VIQSNQLINRKKHENSENIFCDIGYNEWNSRNKRQIMSEVH
jgi:hypothetical protein